MIWWSSTSSRILAPAAARNDGGALRLEPGSGTQALDALRRGDHDEVIDLRSSRERLHGAAQDRPAADGHLPTIVLASDINSVAVHPRRDEGILQSGSAGSEYGRAVHHHSSSVVCVEFPLT